MSLKKKIKVFNFLLTFGVFASLLLLSVFRFGESYLRLGEAFVDVFNSGKNIFFKLFKISSEDVSTVNNYSSCLTWNIILPEDFEALKEMILSFFPMLVNFDNLKVWFFLFKINLKSILKIVVLVFPFVLIAVFVIKKAYNKPNNNYDKDTPALVAFKKIVRATVIPAKKFIFQYIDFWKSTSIFSNLALFIILLNLNVITVIVEFVAYFLYFAATFSLSTFFVQIVKLCIDAQMIFRVPAAVLIVVGIYFIDKLRRSVAKQRLQHMEAKNCGFIKSLPIIKMITGTTGKGKNTVETDMAISEVVMFRQKAFDLLTKNDMKFPNFPWILFEMDIRERMDKHIIYNLVSIKDWIKEKRHTFCVEPIPENIYGYDFNRYGLYYDDALTRRDLFEVLESYAKVYFIYVITSSLIVSNYSVREEGNFYDNGNFPIWVSDFFSEQTANVKDSRFAHILDFDILRLGKRIIDENPNAGSFEFGICLISEIGKERGNNLENIEVKKSSREANPKNDKFNLGLKMRRHSATIDNVCFFSMYADEQRPESWGADARDLCEILEIDSRSEDFSTFPLYTLEEMIYEFIIDKFNSLYYDFRFKRGDNTLLVYLFKKIASFIYNRKTRIDNKYGYSVVTLNRQSGRMEGKVEKKKYYLMRKKIYSDRFSTDCFSGYFDNSARKTDVGLDDYPSYAGKTASNAELQYQNSYWVNELYRTDDK